jgi:hypothetical protein
MERARASLARRLRLAQTRVTTLSDIEARNEVDDPCIICHESLRGESVPVTRHAACGREYHQKCIEDWEKRSPRCPNCQAPMRWLYAHKRGKVYAFGAQILMWATCAFILIGVSSGTNRCSAVMQILRYATAVLNYAAAAETCVAVCFILTRRCEEFRGLWGTYEFLMDERLHTIYHFCMLCDVSWITPCADLSTMVHESWRLGSVLVDVPRDGTCSAVT